MAVLAAMVEVSKLIEKATRMKETTLVEMKMEMEMCGRTKRAMMI